MSYQLLWSFWIANCCCGHFELPIVVVTMKCQLLWSLWSVNSCGQYEVPVVVTWKCTSCVIDCVLSKMFGHDISELIELLITLGRSQIILATLQPCVHDACAQVLSITYCACSKYMPVFLMYACREFLADILFTISVLLFPCMFYC